MLNRLMITKEAQLQSQGNIVKAQHLRDFTVSLTRSLSVEMCFD